MVRDRENKMAESLKIMGLNKYMYALSFLIQRTIWVTLTSLIMASMTYLLNRTFLTIGMFIQLFIAIWLLAVSFLSLSMTLQNMFKEPKLAATCAPFVLFMPTGVALLGIISPLTTRIPNNWV